MAFVPEALLGQVTTGAIEGTLRATDGRPLATAPILATGAAGFRTVIQANSNGEFAMTLPYGRYRLSLDVHHAAAPSTATIFVAPLQTARFDLVVDTSGAMRIIQHSMAGTPGILRHLLQGKLTLHLQMEMSSPTLSQTDEMAAVLQATAKQDQPRFEVVLEVRQLQGGI